MNGDLFSSQPESLPTYTAHCDGGSRGNPGPAGFGAVVQDASGKVVAELSEYLGLQTNNFAEYSGLLAVLKWAAANNVQNLTVVSDSELMVKQLKGQYKVASPVLKPLYDEAKKLSRGIKGFAIRHTLRAGNKHADRLANEAMDKGMGRTPAPAKVDAYGEGRAGSRIAPAASATAPAKKPAPAAGKAKAEGQILEGYVKNGVVHLLGGTLPEGVFVQIHFK